MLALDDTCAHEFYFCGGKRLLVLLFKFDAFEKGFFMMGMTMVVVVMVRGVVARVVGA